MRAQQKRRLTSGVKLTYSEIADLFASTDDPELRAKLAKVLQCREVFDGVTEIAVIDVVA